MATSITFKPLIARRQQRDDGTYNVKIRVTYKRRSRFLATTITAPAKDVDKSGNLRGESLNRGYKLITKFQGYLNDLDFYLAENMDVDDVVKYLRRKGAGPGKFKLDFFTFADKEVLPSKTRGTAEAYRTALNSFKRYLNGTSLDINDITKTMLMDFARHVDNEPKIVVGKHVGVKESSAAKRKGYSSAVYLGKLRLIFKAAADRFNDEDSGIINIPRNPFSGIDMSVKSEIAHIAQSPEVIQRLINFNEPCRRNTRFAIDVFLISFALMGMNTKDMFEAKPAKKGIIIYNRSKTKARRQDKAEHRVKIDPRIKPLIDKYKDPKGERLFNFYILHSDERRMSSNLRFALRTLAKHMGVEPFTMYAARHSWATIARSSRCGIDKATVDDCLVHVGDHRLADVYAEKDWQVFWDANKKVLDVFDWSAIQK
jgi:hypothetical protein